MQLAALAIFALSAGGGWAADQQFEFALPDVNGRISLGVFDAQGKLVRSLFVAADASQFKIGLNGYISHWDEKGDDGSRLPSGKYYVRGFVVGLALRAEGQAYHFNDWIDSETGPQLTRIDDFRRVAGGFVLLGKTAAEPERVFAMRYDEGRGCLWQTPLPSPAVPESPPGDHPPLLAVTSEWAVAAIGGQIYSLGLGDGAVQIQHGLDFAPAALAAYGSSALLAADDGLREAPLPGFDSFVRSESPAAFLLLAASGERRIGSAAGEPGVWICSQDRWAKLAIPAAIRSLALGPRNTFWVAATRGEDGQAFVGQFEETGRFLREYHSDLSPVKIDASGSLDEIAVLEEDPGLQRLTALQLQPQGSQDAKPQWQILSQKSIQACGSFGILDGRLVPDAGQIPQVSTMMIKLNTGGLGAPGHGNLQIEARAVGGALWLAARSGLLLVQLADFPSASRIVIQPDTRLDAMNLFAGNGAVVAEYRVTGLNQIAAIDAGEIDLP